MKVQRRDIEGFYAITSPPAYVDKRGSLMRIYDAGMFKEQGIDISWLQQSFSHTSQKNVLRGLHVQLAPFTEAKLITVLKGEMYWVVVDVRKNSPTFGKWDAVLLTRNNINSIFVSPGFAHGCLSMTHECDLVISSDNFYSQDHSTGILWNDPELAIEWPVGDSEPIISDEHKAYQDFNSFRSRYSGI